MSHVICQSGIGERIWGLLEKDSALFDDEVQQYFLRAMPGWVVVQADPISRVVYLRDERVIVR